MEIKEARKIRRLELEFDSTTRRFKAKILRQASRFEG